jgi:hypothetical protein
VTKDISAESVVSTEFQVEHDDGFRRDAICGDCGDNDLSSLTIAPDANKYQQTVPNGRNGEFQEYLIKIRRLRINANSSEFDCGA